MAGSVGHGTGKSWINAQPRASSRWSRQRELGNSRRGDLMYSGKRFIAAGAAVLACLACVPPPTLAPELPGVIEGIFPTQLPAGQTTVLHAGLPGRGEVTAIDIQPAAGITVKNIARGD